MEQGDLDDVDGPDGYRHPPAPDDRLWRHPSELAWAAPARPPRRGFGTAAVAAFGSSVLTVGLLAVAGAFDDEPAPAAPAAVVREAVQPSSAPPADTRSVVGLAAKVRQAIVRLEVTGSRSGTGSGVVFRDDGLVMTNAHVVRGASKVVAILADGRRLGAGVVGLDAETDIAVIRLDDAGGPLPTALLGTVESLEVGEVAVAVGSPLGLAGPASVSAGVVSALGREVTSEDGAALVDLIQTDATIAPGSSGGALVDGDGVVVGITTAFAVDDSGAEGVGFATTIDVARAVAEDLVDDGVVSPPWIGLKGEDDPRGGVMVTAVVEKSPASAVRLVAGDVVTAVDGRPVGSMSGLRIYLRRLRPGDTVSVTWRHGTRITTRAVTLAPRP